MQDKGGWQSRDTAKAFGDYAGHVARRLGDRCKYFFTLNEFQNFVDIGHRGVELTVQGKPVSIELAPGLKLEQGPLNQVAHHAVLAPRLLNSLWRPKEIYITENGCAASDQMAADGKVYDLDRVMYLRNVMAQLQRAISEGAPVKGNFVWSAFDNLEWTGGFGTRFGMVYVDFQTQQRTPKLSAAWFKEAARRNAVV